MPYAELPGVRLHYEVRGSGPPLVLIPGLGGDTGSWSAVAPRLTRSFELLLIENRGSGQTLCPDTVFSLADLADDTAGFIGKLGRGSVAVVGHSMGGCVALDLAARYPHLVRSMVVIGSCTRVPTRAARVLQGLVRARNSGMPLQEWFALFFSWLFSPARQENLTFLDVAAALAASSGRVQSGHDFRRQVGSLLRVDLGPMLVNVGCPTLVLHGDSDLLIPSEAGRSLAAGITGAEFRALAGVGHLAQAESAERVCAAIEGFVPAGACAPAQDPG